MISTQEPTDDEIEAELNTMLGAPAAAAALADVKQEAKTNPSPTSPSLA